MIINEGHLCCFLFVGNVLGFWERLNHSNESNSAGRVWKIPSDRGAWPGWSLQGQDSKLLNSQKSFSPSQFSSTMWTWWRKYKTNGVITAAAVCRLVPFIQDVQGTGQQCTNPQLAPSLLKKTLLEKSLFKPYFQKRTDYLWLSFPLMRHLIKSLLIRLAVWETTFLTQLLHSNITPPHTHKHTHTFEKKKRWGLSPVSVIVIKRYKTTAGGKMWEVWMSLGNQHQRSQEPSSTRQPYSLRVIWWRSGAAWKLK